MTGPRRHRLGVLMLDTRFPRPVGDIGNPATFPFEVIYRKVPSASVAAVVTREGLPEALIELFCDEARALAEAGATLITTSCGFLSVLQDRLSACVPVPVVTSSLHLMAHLRKLYGPAASIGILTFDSRQLATHHIPDPGPYTIAGIESGTTLHRVIRQDLPNLDTGLARQDAVDAALALCARGPRPSLLVLECTNLPPYREAIARASGLAVFDILDAIALELGIDRPTGDELCNPRNS